MIPIIDTHTDLIHSYLEFGNPILFKEVRKQMTISSLKKSGVKIFFAGFSGDDERGDSVGQLEIYKKVFKENNIKLILGKEDISNLYTSRAAILHIEGGDLIKTMGDLENFYSLGIRSIGLAFSNKNSLSCGATHEGKDSGLTKIGREVVRHANSSGIIIDLAHASEKTFNEVVSISNKPVIISHTACRSLLDHPRNTTDSQIKKIASQGGTIGIFFSKFFISKKPKIRVNDVLKHYGHVADLVGVKHLTIGSDFAGISKGTPIGLESYLKLQDFLGKMRKFGFSKLEVEDIAYKNCLRVLKEILN